MMLCGAGQKVSEVEKATRDLNLEQKKDLINQVKKKVLLIQQKKQKTKEIKMEKIKILFFVFLSIINLREK